MCKSIRFIQFRLTNFMKRFEEFISEQSRAYLYHATKYRYALSIIQENKLEGKTFHTKAHNIANKLGSSFTRNYEFAFNWSQGIFVVDQDKIKAKNKIVPINFYLEKHEFEEFVIGDIDNFLSYVVSINLLPSNNLILEDIIAELRAKKLTHLINKEIPAIFKTKYLTTTEMLDKY